MFNISHQSGHPKKISCNSWNSRIEVREFFGQILGRGVRKVEKVEIAIFFSIICLGYFWCLIIKPIPPPPPPRVPLGIWYKSIFLTRSDTSAGAVDVHVNRLLAALRLQEEELGDDDAGQGVVDGSHQTNDSLLQQPRVDVVRPLAATRLLDHDRDEAAVDAVVLPPEVDRFEEGRQRLLLLPKKQGRLPRHFRGNGKRHSCKIMERKFFTFNFCLLFYFSLIPSLCLWMTWFSHRHLMKLQIGLHSLKSSDFGHLLAFKILKQYFLMKLLFIKSISWIQNFVRKYVVRINPWFNCRIVSTLSSEE